MPPAYATAADISIYALPSVRLSRVVTKDRDAALEVASRYADSFVAAQGRYSVPLAAWDLAMTAAVCDVAAYNLLTREGFDSADQGSSYRKRRDDAVTWFKEIGKGDATIVGSVSVESGTSSSGARVSTRTPLGWHGPSTTTTSDEDFWGS